MQIIRGKFTIKLICFISFIYFLLFNFSEYILFIMFKSYANKKIVYLINVIQRNVLVFFYLFICAVF